jgi:5-methylcytosine-specific restriction endonuclease McrA
MPTLPKARKRSWIKTMPKQTRQHDNSAFYHSKAWRMTRKFYIKDNPLCEMCKRKGQTTAAQMVDHIKQISLGGSMLHHSNLQSLCNSCHAKKSSYEGVEYRKGIKDYERQK